MGGIRFRVIGDPPDHFLCVVAGPVAVKRKRKPCPATGCGMQPQLEIRRFGDRERTPERHPRIICTLMIFRISARCVTGQQLAHHMSERVFGKVDLKGIPGLQKNGFRPAESLAHRAVRRLTKISAFRMLHAGPAADERNLHIRQRRSGEHAGMLIVEHGVQHLLLPVRIQFIRAQTRRGGDAAAALARFDQKMHLRVMAERLVMAHALRRSRRRLPVHDPFRSEGHSDAETASDQAGQHLGLNLAHDLNMNILPLRVPRQMERRILILQHMQFPEDRCRIRPFGQDQPAGHHGFQHRRLRIRLRAEALAGHHGGEPGHGADRSGRRFSHGRIPVSGEQSDLINFLRDRRRVRIFSSGMISDRVTHPEHASCHLHAAQPLSLRVAADLVHLHAERGGIRLFGQIPPEALQQGVDSLHTERRSEPYRKQLPPAYCLRDHRIRKRAVFQQRIQQLLIRERDLLVPLRQPGCKIDTPG